MNTAVITTGGLGTRMGEESKKTPKPMIEIGGIPIISHIMNRYSLFGINDFIIALGYKGHIIKDYFLNYKENISDFKINTKFITDFAGNIGTPAMIFYTNIFVHYSL